MDCCRQSRTRNGPGKRRATASKRKKHNFRAKTLKGTAVADSSSGRFRPWIALAILTSLYTAAFIDRQVLNLLVDPIKRSLSITETQFSLLQGLAFMLSFALLSPVAGRLVDRLNRPMLLAGAALTWSLFTIACGLADSFTALFLARVGIGAAEASVTPTALSYLADAFDRKRLPRALSIFLLGPSLGAGLAMIFGGVLIRHASAIAASGIGFASLAPWQMVFVLVGLPGLLLALLVARIPEPPRHHAAGKAAAEGDSVGDVLRFLWQARAFFAPLAFGMTAVVLVLYAVPSWMPAVLIRGLGVDAAKVGVQYGVAALIAGTAGVLSGPLFARLLERRGYRNAVLLVPAISAVGLLFSCLLVAVPVYPVALGGAALASFFFGMPQPMAATALQLATPPRMRGLVTSFFVLITGVIAMTMATTSVAVITEHVLGDLRKVGLSLMIVCTTSAAIAIWLLVLAGKEYRPLEVE